MTHASNASMEHGAGALQSRQQTLPYSYRGDAFYEALDLANVFTAPHHGEARFQSSEAAWWPVRAQFHTAHTWHTLCLHVPPLALPFALCRTLQWSRKNAPKWDTNLRQSRSHFAIKKLKTEVLAMFRQGAAEHCPWQSLQEMGTSHRAFDAQPQRMHCAGLRRSCRRFSSGIS